MRSRRYVALCPIVTIVAMLSGCATSPATAGFATPWAAAGIHSFKPKTDELAPNPAKLDQQVARLLDDATLTSQDADTRVAAR